MCLRIISRRFDVLVIFSNEGIEWRWVIAGVIPTETEVLLSILILFLTESLTEPRPLNLNVLLPLIKNMLSVLKFSISLSSS